VYTGYNCLAISHSIYPIVIVIVIVCFEIISQR
jgi:hypothetical protein